MSHALRPTVLALTLLAAGPLPATAGRLPPPQKPVQIDIAGRVVDPDGRSVAKSRVTLWLSSQIAGEPEWLDTTSGPDGGFRFQAVRQLEADASGDIAHRLVARADGFGFGWSKVAVHEKA